MFLDLLIIIQKYAFGITTLDYSDENEANNPKSRYYPKYGRYNDPGGHSFNMFFWFGWLNYWHWNLKQIMLILERKLYRSIYTNEKLK